LRNLDQVEDQPGEHGERGRVERQVAATSSSEVREEGSGHDR
jgi:hypothetical protein